MGCLQYVNWLQPDKGWKFHRGPGLPIELSKENNQACLTLVVLVPGLVWRRAVVTKDHGCRTLTALYCHPLHIVSATHDDGLRTWKRSHTTAYLLLSFSQYAGYQRLILILYATADAC